MTNTTEKLIELSKQGIIGYFEGIATMSQSKDEVKGHFLDVNNQLRTLIHALDDELKPNIDKSKDVLLATINQTNTVLTKEEPKPKKARKKKLTAEPVINPKWDEEILAVNVNDLFENGKLEFEGVTKDKDLINSIISNIDKHFQVKRRGNVDDPTSIENNMELNTNFKQPIPYVVLKRGNEYFTYERLDGGGESRLKANLSLGVGGHMNPIVENAPFDDTLYLNLQRELEEELVIGSGTRDLEYVGLINDNSNEVSRVHLGILATLELEEGTKVEVRETDSLRGTWLTLEELKDNKNYDLLENWSQLVVDSLEVK